MTRIRVNVKDGSKADRQAIKNTPGVLGVVGDEPDYIQVVLGPGKVRDVMQICTTKLGVKEQAPGQGAKSSPRVRWATGRPTRRPSRATRSTRS